ncbi:MAG TPA: ribbon-helix-helix protein, CopG family, partial [Vicinamibacteria bacterium]|nr:ribbon-helix-helix protein, CopG family [Vicinamibacteria bacterium]
MATRKVTFTLDVETVARLRRASERLSKPQSAVVREAIRDYSDRIGRLSEAERLALLERFDELVPRIPRRPLREVEKE